MTEPTLVRLGPDDADAVYALLDACGRHMAATHGLHHWQPPPATAEQLRDDAATRTMLALRDGVGALVASVVVSERPWRDYAPALAAGAVRWAVDAPVAGYVGRLAVHPAAQRGGHGARLLRAAEDAARAWGAAAVRLDALAANTALLAWYQRLGYVARGRRHFRGHDFAALERVLP